jgi:hypothetical protein
MSEKHTEKEALKSIARALWTIQPLLIEIKTEMHATRIVLKSIDNSINRLRITS